jgi:hypothetical protein
MAAGHAKPQVHPRVADSQAVLAAVSAGGYLADLVDVSACVHCVLERTTVPRPNAALSDLRRRHSEQAQQLVDDVGNYDGGVPERRPAFSS